MSSEPPARATTAILAGAATVEGEAIAAGLAARGVEVLRVDRDGTGPSPVTWGVDVWEAGNVAAIVEDALARWGRIDLLVNATAMDVRRHPFVDLPSVGFERSMALSVRVPFLTLKHVLPVMMRQGRGRVLNVASPLARRGGAGAAGLSASHHGLFGLTMNVAHEYAGHGVRTHLLCVASDLGATPDDIGAAAAWLLLDSPDRLNGHVMVLDGGRSVA